MPDFYSEVDAARITEDRAKQYIREQVTGEADEFETTGFGETLSAGWNIQQREFVSKAQYNAEAPIRERDEHIDRLVLEGVVSEEELSRFLIAREGNRPVTEAEVEARKIEREQEKNLSPTFSVANAYLTPLGHPVDARVPDYARLAEYLRTERGIEDIQTDDELREMIATELAEGRAEDERTIAKARSGWSASGQFVGAIAGAIWDPINLPLMFTPGAAYVRGAGMASNVGRAAGAGALAAVGEEAAFMAGQAEFRDTYGLAPVEPVKQLVMAAGIGAVMGGGVASVADVIIKRRQGVDPIDAAADPADPPPVRQSADEVDAARQAENDAADLSPNAEDGVPSTEQLRRMNANLDTPDENGLTIRQKAAAFKTDEDGPSLADEIDAAAKELDDLEGFKACLLGDA